MAAARSSTVVGATIGKHRIVRLIGGGEASRVFACRDNDLQSERLVAVKMLRSRASSVADRLTQQSATVTQIVSPHVVQVFDVAVYKNMPTIVMELVEGESLAALLEQGPLPGADVLEVARSICLGLHAAWALGVAHGDLRPKNVLLPEEDVRQAKVGDFLLAAPIEGNEAIRGAAAYLAPELLHGAGPDVQSDLYALGCLLFECVAGETPFTGTSAVILKAQAGKTAPSLATRVRGPRGLVDLVDRLIEKDRGKRFKTHTEVLTAIARILRSATVHELAQQQAPELDPDVVDELDVAPKPAASPTARASAVATSPRPAPRPPAQPAVSLDELEVDPRAAAAFAGVHDEGVEMTRVADASMLLRGAARPPPAPARPTRKAEIEELEIDPHAAEAFEGVHDEGIEMTRVASVPTPLEAMPPRPKQPAALDMLTKLLDDRGAAAARGPSPAPQKKSAADIRGAPARVPQPASGPAASELDEKTRVTGGIAAKYTSAEEDDLVDEPLPPRKPRR